MKIIVRFHLVATLAIAFCASTALAEPYLVEKVHTYAQTSATGAVATPQPYVFSAGSPTATVLHPPGGTAVTLAALSDRFSLVQYFADRATLDAAYPTGTYTLTGTGIPTLSFDLSGSLFPTAVPQLTSGTWTNGVLVIDPAKSNAINISAFTTYASAGVAGHESMELDTDTSTFHQQIATQAVLGLTASATPFTALTIPAATLTAGRVYRLRLNFDTLTTLDTTSVSGNGAIAIYSNTLEVWVAAIGAATVVPAAPAITSQPRDTPAVLGGSATFAASVSYNYDVNQMTRVAWFFNGTELNIDQNDPKYTQNFGGSTQSLTVKNVTAADVGRYSMKIITIAGIAATADAALTLTTAAAPTITSGPVAVTVGTGASAVFSAGATGSPPISYQWLKNGAALPSATNRILWLQNTSSSDAADYSLRITNSVGTVTSAPAKLQVINSSDPGRLINLSVLAVVASGETVAIGTHLQGNGARPLPLLIRAGGPSLAPFSISAFLPDPMLALFGAGSVQVATNNDWGGSQQMIDAFNAAGAFGYVSPTSKDAAIYQAALPPGDYSARVSDAGTGSGSVIAEIYDDAPGAFDPGRNRLTNLSVFKHIAGGDSLSLGFTVGGSTAKTFLIRAIGPGLALFQIGDIMADPNLTLKATSTGTVLATNDNWGGNGVITRAMKNVNAFEITDANSGDAMLLISLPPGLYSAVAQGPNNAAGNVIVEVYDVL